MPTVLVTGFEPFGGAATNNSWDAVELVGGIGGLVTLCLPVEYGRASDVLDAAIREHAPDLVIAVGLAEGRTAITPERVAINVEDARIADNAGAQPVDAPVVPGAPDAHFTRLPVKAIVAAIAEAGIPADLSDSAGTFVCNSVMYRLLEDHPGIVAGFIHVPEASVIPAAQVARALTIAVEVAQLSSTNVI